MDKSFHLEAVSARFDAMYPALTEDARFALDRAAEDATPHNRRGAFRVAFSAIEGLVFLLKDQVLPGAKSSGDYSNAEIAMLAEEAYQLDNRGNAVTVTRFLRLADNLLFTWKMFFRSVLPNFSVDLSGEGWRCLKSALDVRNRITHPKSPSDLDVSDVELTELRTGFDWVIGTTIRNMAAAILWCRERTHTYLDGAIPADILDWLDELAASEHIAPTADVCVQEVSIFGVHADALVLATLELNGLAHFEAGCFALTAKGVLYLQWRAKKKNQATQPPDNEA